MEHMRARAVYFCFVLMAFAAAICVAGDSSMDRGTLRGLKAIKVVVDPATTEMEHEGLDRQRLQSAIEQKLRDAGIQVDNDANEFLGVTLSSARGSRRGPFSVAVGLGVYQTVLLNRDKTIKSVTETWGDQRVLSTTARTLDHFVSGAVDELVDQFIRAYRSVNPQ